MLLNGATLDEVNVVGEPITDDSFLLLFNPHHEAVRFLLPKPAEGKVWEVCFDTKNVMAAKRGAPVRRFYNLIDRSMAVQSAAAPAAAAPVPSGSAPQPSGGLAPVVSSNNASNNVTSPKIGKEVGAVGSSVRGCIAGDSSPAGTVVDGYKKQVVSTPFGNQCSWIPAK